MPEMDGLQLMLELTSNYLHVKVIAMAGGLEGEASLHVAKLLGVRQTFHKPIEMDKLLSAVRDALAAPPTNINPQNKSDPPAPRTRRLRGPR
jgi:DNA-binding NtrC family response regulator